MKDISASSEIIRNIDQEADRLIQYAVFVISGSEALIISPLRIDSASVKVC